MIIAVVFLLGFLQKTNNFISHRRHENFNAAVENIMGSNQAHHQRCRKDTEKSRPQDEDNRIYAFPDEGTPDGPRPESFLRRQDFHFSHHKRIGKLAKPIFQKTCQDNTL